MKKMLRGSLRRIPTVNNYEQLDSLPTEGDCCEISGNQTSNILDNGLKLSSRLIPRSSGGCKNSKHIHGHKNKHAETSNSDNMSDSQCSASEDEQSESDIVGELDNAEGQYSDPLLDRVNEETLSNIILDLKVRKSQRRANQQQ